MLVGRAREAQLLADRLRRDRAVLVVGEPGIGKTALLRDATASAGRGSVAGGALASLSWMPYLPLARALGTRRLDGDTAAVARRVAVHLAGRILVVDDVHWADEGTIEVLELLAPTVPILAASRPAGPSLADLHARLAAAGFGLVELLPLDDVDAEALVRARRGDLTDTTVRRLVRRSGGNPLLLRELAGHDGAPSESLRLLVDERMAALGSAALDTFSMLALAGRPIPRAALDASAVEELQAARLASLVAHDVEIRHALIGELAVACLDPVSAARLHRRLAAIVESPGERARHLAAAGERRAAAEVALAAAAGEAHDRPVERAAHLAVAARCSDGPAADGLRLAAATALSAALDHTGAEAILDDLASDDVAVRVDAAILRSRTRLGRSDPEGARQALYAGMAAAREADAGTAARMLVESSREWMFIEWKPLKAVATAEAGMAAAEASGIPVARPLMLLGLAYYVADDPRWLATTERALTSARTAGDLETELPTANNLITGHESAGDPRIGRRVAAEMIERTEALGLETWRTQFRAMAINLDLHAAELGAVVEQATELLDEPLDPATRRQVENSLQVALVDLGKFDAVTERLASSGDAGTSGARNQTATDHWIAAEAALWGGRPEAALQLARQAVGAGFDDVFAPLVARWAALELSVDVDEPLPPTDHPLEQGARPESIGIRELATGRLAEAVCAFDEAADHWRPFHARGELRSRWGAAEALRRAGAVDEAHHRLLDLERALLAKGMGPLLARTHRSLRLLGVRRAAPRTRSDVRGLTAREREVLDLVAGGLTNAEIARRLGVARPTVTTLLRSGMSRLGASSRGQAAAILAGAAS